LKAFTDIENDDHFARSCREAVVILKLTVCPTPLISLVAIGVGLFMSVDCALAEGRWPQ